jgi:hypothetical protein
MDDLQELASAVIEAIEELDCAFFCAAPAEQALYGDALVQANMAASALMSALEEVEAASGTTA